MNTVPVYMRIVGPIWKLLDGQRRVTAPREIQLVQPKRPAPHRHPTPPLFPSPIMLATARSTDVRLSTRSILPRSLDLHADTRKIPQSLVQPPSASPTGCIPHFAATSERPSTNARVGAPVLAQKWRFGSRWKESLGHVVRAALASNIWTGQVIRRQGCTLRSAP